MDDTAPYIPIESLTGDFLPLFRQAMQKTGPRAQTFAALTRLAKEGRGHRTFARLGLISDVACLPIRTVREHLEFLVATKWIKHLGQERLGPETDQRRRTVTYELGQEAIWVKRKETFATLPRWAASVLPTWAQRAAYAEIVSRHLLVESIEGGCPEERYEVSLTQLSAATGLHRRSAIRARNGLATVGAIRIDGESTYLRERFIPEHEALVTIPHASHPAPSGGIPAPLTNPPTSSDKSAQTLVKIPHASSDKSAMGGVINPPSLLRELVKTSSERSLCKTPCKNSDAGPATALTEGFFRNAFRTEADIWKILPIGNYPPDDHLMVWKGACLVNAGFLSEDIVLAAAEGVSRSREPVRSPVGLWIDKMMRHYFSQGGDPQDLKHYQPPERPRLNGHASEYAEQLAERLRIKRA